MFCPSVRTSATTLLEQVFRILTDPSAKGVYYFNRMRQLENSWQTEPKPEHEWGKVECEPIVSEDQWNQVNRLIEEHTKAWKRPGPSPVHLFGGLAECKCGTRMYVRAKTPKYFCRKCCNKIPIADLEAIILEELQSFFGQLDRVKHHVEEAERNVAEKSALLETHRREIQKVREEMRQTHQLYLNKQISGDGFRDLYTPAEERLGQLNAELPRLEAEVDFLKINKLSAEDVVHESATLHKRWPTLPPEDKRRIVEAIIEKIVIGDGEIDITYSCAPSSEKQCKNQQELIALLAFEQRHVRLSRAHIPVNRAPRKRIPTSIQTLGDYVHAKRYEKGLQRYQVAGRMGIAESLVLAWEKGVVRPDQVQWQMLGRLLGFDSGIEFQKPNR